MRLIKVQFNGYKRLLDTGCNVDAPLVALVGPNEAGKSSVLEALEWLTEEDTELPHERVNRGIGLTTTGPTEPDMGGEIVVVEYLLSDEDRAALDGIDLAEAPRRCWLGKSRGGRRTYRFDPQPTRRRDLAEAVLALVPKSSLSDDDADEELAEDVDTVVQLAQGGGEWDAAGAQAVARVVAWLTGEEHSEAQIPARTRKEDAKLAAKLEAWTAQMGSPAPYRACWDALKDRVPEFLLFGTDDRVLRDDYNLTWQTIQPGGQAEQEVPHEDVTDPDAGLVNLLALGGTTIMELWRVARLGDSTRIRMFEQDVNKRLKVGLSPYWGQAPVAVEIKIDGQVLRVHIHEDTQVSRFTERSDGFRTFLTLVVYLARHATDQPPVLLIDEAETHLHYDAQADLVNYLLGLGVRTIYTTHSPGCLPPDLGTGIRVVRPVRAGVSELRNDFWTGGPVGLSPLLYAMGAGVAALSRFRAAVFTEGPSDMILLPSLIRAATGEDRVPYQVVPGLSSLRADQMGEPDLSAVRVAYLVDGDDGGDELKKQLLDGGVKKAKIVQLKRGWATEDLLDPALYVETVNAILTDSGRTSETLAVDDVVAATAADVPISTAVSNLLRGNAPGKPIVAARLVQEPSRLRLAKGAATALKALDRKFRTLLDLTDPDAG